MRKAKVILSAIVLCAAIGGTVAVKASKASRTATYFYYVAGGFCTESYRTLWTTQAGTLPVSYSPNPTFLTSCSTLVRQGI